MAAHWFDPSPHPYPLSASFQACPIGYFGGEGLRIQEEKGPQSGPFSS